MTRRWPVPSQLAGRIDRLVLVVAFLLLPWAAATRGLAAQSDVSQPVSEPAAIVLLAQADESTATADPTWAERGAVEVAQDAAEAGQDAAEPSELPPWIQQIDEKFGGVVWVLEKVIFFDFFSEHYLPVKIPFVVVWLFGGAVFLTIRMRFINFRAFRHAVRLTKGDYDDSSEPGDVSHFQALAAALSATVGLGNIAGVAIAIRSGGPGAAFWILVVGLLGMTSKFAECTLAQIYRTKDDSGKVLGGPMRYLRVGLTELGFPRLGRVLAVLFMLLCIGASFGGGNAFQIGQSLDTIRGQFEVLDNQPWIYGVVMALTIGLVIIGGIRSIGAVASMIVPFMCGAYVLAALFILGTHASEIPAAIVTIVTEAFNPTAIKGGFLGVMVIGIQRAVFSNEAGIGSAAIVHSAAKTDEPVSEGIVALLEPFIDTVLVCSMTALVVVITGAYVAPELAGISDGEGARVTLHAFVTGGYDWFAYVLYVSVVLFAFSTCISWSYYGERCWAQLFGASTSLIYKLLFLGFTFLGSIVTRGNILTFSDLMLLGMALPNLLGVFLLSGIVKRRLDDYWERYRQGQILTIREQTTS